MKRFLKQLRQVGYTVFSFVFFLISATGMTLIGLILITIGGATKKHKQQYHQILQRLSRFIIYHIPGTTFSFDNPQKENFESPCMIISNHQSHIDLMAIMMLSPNLIILTKNWVWHNPFYGLVIRYADFFPVSETERMTQNLAVMIKQGYSIMIFPEGTRSVDCHIQRFHKGAFYIAEQLKLDIVPVYIEGFGQVLPKKSWTLHPGHLRLEVMPRIKQSDIKNSYTCRDLTKHVHRIYLNRSK